MKCIGHHRHGVEYQINLVILNVNQTCFIVLFCRILELRTEQDGDCKKPATLDGRIILG